MSADRTHGAGGEHAHDEHPEDWAGAGRDGSGAGVWVRGVEQAASVRMSAAVIGPEKRMLV